MRHAPRVLQFVGELPPLIDAFLTGGRYCPAFSLGRGAIGTPILRGRRFAA